MPSTINYHRAGAGEPLVLIHGIGSRWQVWLPVLEALQRERDVIAIDLPGFGFSPMPPPGTPAGVPSLTRLVIELLDDLGLERPHVAGNSLGGWLSLELARAGRARSATALSPGGFYEGALERGLLRMSLGGTHKLIRRARPFLHTALASGPGRRAIFAHLLVRGDRMDRFDAIETALALADAPWFEATLTELASHNFRDGTSIDVPVTIAWGQHDHLLLPHQAKRAAAEIPSARILTLHGCGHVPTYDDPEQVARVLLDGSAGT